MLHYVNRHTKGWVCALTAYRRDGTIIPKPMREALRRELDRDRKLIAELIDAIDDSEKRDQQRTARRRQRGAARRT